MGEKSVINGVMAEHLARFAEPLRPVLALAEKNQGNDKGLLLLSFVGAFAHPDFVCNLAMLDTLPPAEKSAVIGFFDFCVTRGLAIDECAALVDFVNTRITM